MDRREFTALVGAGLLFPADFVNGLAARADIPRSQTGALIFCCGSDYNPVTEAQMCKLMDFLEMEKQWLSVIEYGRKIGAPVHAIYRLDFPLDRLVVGLGSDDRPAQEEDLSAVRDQLRELADEWDESEVITHHNFYPYEFQGCTLHDSPVVMTHRMTHRWSLRLGRIRPVVPKWITQWPDPVDHPLYYHGLADNDHLCHPW